MADKKQGQGARGSARGEIRAQVYGQTSLDVEALRQIVEILEASEVSRLVWQNGDEKLVIRRGPPPQQVVQAVAPMPMPMPSAGVHVMPQAAPVAPAPAAPAASPALAAPRPSMPGKASSAGAAEAKKGFIVTSPFVGTFYRTPAPDQPPFVDVGSVVKKGQVLCIVEAMKLMNEIESEAAGKVVEILVQNAQPVEFGQQLFRIEPV
jgi:acetyl-CoA carboxylase biotin carboxyl carrier protein